MPETVRKLFYFQSSGGTVFGAGAIQEQLRVLAYGIPVLGQGSSFSRTVTDNKNEFSECGKGLVQLERLGQTELLFREAQETLRAHPTEIAGRVKDDFVARNEAFPALLSGTSACRSPYN